MNKFRFPTILFILFMSLLVIATTGPAVAYSEKYKRIEPSTGGFILEKTVSVEAFDPPSPDLIIEDVRYEKYRNGMNHELMEESLIATVCNRGNANLEFSLRNLKSDFDNNDSNQKIFVRMVTTDQNGVTFSNEKSFAALNLLIGECFEVNFEAKETIHSNKP